LLDPVEQSICMRLPNACVCVVFTTHSRAFNPHEPHMLLCRPMLKNNNA
jgi:hypothetical protein